MRELWPTISPISLPVAYAFYILGIVFLLRYFGRIDRSGKTTWLLRPSLPSLIIFWAFLSLLDGVTTHAGAILTGGYEGEFMPIVRSHATLWLVVGGKIVLVVFLITFAHLLIKRRDGQMKELLAVDRMFRSCLYSGIMLTLWTVINNTGWLVMAATTQ